MFYLAVTLAGVILISPSPFKTEEECLSAYTKLTSLSPIPRSSPASQPSSLPSPCVWEEPACGRRQKQKCRGRAD